MTNDTGTRVLVVDGTGRGHAVCSLFTRTDPHVTVYYGPGCDVIDEERIVPVGSVTLDEPQTALDFLAETEVDFVFVGNIDALSLGYVDKLRAGGHLVIGPTREAAELESSKERGKRFCLEHGLPTASYRHFTSAVAARTHVRSLPGACVVKVDGLTPDGDGSVVCSTTAEAEAAVDTFARRYPADLRLIVEERLHGREISVFALLDGDSYLMFPTAMDFKRTLESDAGKNCDGMGSVSPHPDADPALLGQVREQLLDPLVRGLRAEGLDFTGFVYVGAMLTAEGLKILEINARFGDSEAEAVLPGVRSDFTELCRAVLARDLAGRHLITDGLVRCSVAATQGCLDPQDPDALPGWPFGRYSTGQPVTGLDAVGSELATVYYANLRRDTDGRPVTSGGRVLHVVGAGASLADARSAAYARMGRIGFPGLRYRSDIGAGIETRRLQTSCTGIDTSWPQLDNQGTTEMTVFETVESSVRSYTRSFPGTFHTAKGDLLYTEDGSQYIDFLSGASALNYGHNPEHIKRALIDYLEADGLTHGLDLATTAKASFLEALRDLVLAPRDLDYRVQFCSPTGTNAVEAALKLARLVTGRQNVVSFSGGFHGMSTGSLAVTGSAYYKQGLYGTLPRTTQLPYPCSPFGDFDSLDLLDRLVRDPSSGAEKPAAVILETVQGEGGVYVAPEPFLRGLRDLCSRHGILLIVDDIQAGCGRTGTFFSFEQSGIRPDVVTLSKSIGGYGLPLALVLISPEYDIWQPGQHNGTFRGNQLAFVAGTHALRTYWADGTFAAQVQRKGALVADYLARRVTAPYGVPIRGRGLLWGIDLGGVDNGGVDNGGVDNGTAGKVSRLCFDRGLVIETCGRDGEVLKLLPPLTVSQANLVQGLDIMVDSLDECLRKGE